MAGTKLIINGKAKTVDAPAEMPLLWILRDLLGLTGTKWVFRETIKPPIRLVVFGAGNDAIPMVEIAVALGWEPTEALDLTP